MVLTLKDDMLEYLEESKLKSLIQRHSEFIDFPIELWTEKKVDKEITDDDSVSEEEENDDDKPNDDKLDDDKLDDGDEGQNRLREAQHDGDDDHPQQPHRQVFLCFSLSGFIQGKPTVTFRLTHR